MANELTWEDKQDIAQYHIWKIDNDWATAKGYALMPQTRRFTIFIQTVEVDAHGEIIDGFDHLGPLIATTSIDHAKLAAARLGELSAEILRGYAEPSTISNLYPEEK